MTDAKLERIYTVPLGEAYGYIRTRRARRTVKILRQFLARHMKSNEKSVRISNALNNSIWQRGIQKPPRRVKIRAVKDGELVKAYLSDEKIVEKKPEKKEQKPEEKPKEAPKAEVKSQEQAKPEQRKEVNAPEKVAEEKPKKAAGEKKQPKAEKASGKK